MSVDQRVGLLPSFDRDTSRRRFVRSSVAGIAAAALGGRFASGGTAQTPAATSLATPAAGTLNVRPNGATLSAEQKLAYVNAVRALKVKPSPWIPSISTYDTFVLWHRDAFGCALTAAHMGPAFFPWHRMYLHLFEQQLQLVDPTVSLPYWDWSVDREIDSWVWQDDFMGGDGSDDDDEAVITGPFRKGEWELTIFDYNDVHQTPWITRDLGMGGLAPDLPTPEDVEAALTVDTYDSAPWSASSPIAESFRNTMEGWRDCVEDMCDPVAGSGTMCTGEHLLHNRVHLWVSGEFAFAHEMPEMAPGATPVAGEDMVLGTMAANSSPNDPVLFQHHANIDRLWSAWMQRHGQRYLPEMGGPVGHNIDDRMWPYHQIDLEITPRMMLESRSLGYIYDTEA
ncbi:MAG: tyrosinase family protein [Thermomicrobiales bacterium]